MRYLPILTIFLISCATPPQNPSEFKVIATKDFTKISFDVTSKTLDLATKLIESYANECLSIKKNISMDAGTHYSYGANGQPIVGSGVQSSLNTVRSYTTTFEKEPMQTILFIQQDEKGPGLMNVMNYPAGGAYVMLVKLIKNVNNLISGEIYYYDSAIAPSYRKIRDDIIERVGKNNHNQCFLNQ